MCFLGMLGIVLMIIESELSFNRVDHKDSTFSLFTKATISFSSIILVGLVFYYHHIDLNLYCVDNSIDDWRIALTRTKMCSIVLEAIICMIHPIPGHFLVEWGSQYVKKAEDGLNFINPYRSSQNTLTTAILPNSTMTPSANLVSAVEQSKPYVPIDVMLSLPSKFVKRKLCSIQL